ncbi:hypothetical protein Sango_2451700 [Sesamum angolense]|uniref:Uncharacterized protein n=1 Tax=Sesamum angolense TaxID=2727404 RepID=A0AAE1W832_9LAMI|nr:hypothetical protein Sango_2451700 [Sesamum angolense]
MECGEIKHLELALIDLFTRVKFGRSEAKRSRNGYLVYDSVASGTARFIKSSWIRMRGEIANRISAVLDTREESQCGGNAFSVKCDGLMRLVEIIKGERYNQSAEDRDKGIRQSEDHLFLAAVEEALFEVKKRSALGLTCKCLNPSNFRPTEVQGFLEVDVAGYGARSKYSIKQIKKARNGFKPREMVSFLQKLALNPTIDTQNNFTLTRNVARVLAYRKSVFEEPDETYPQEFEAQAADSEHHADVSYGKKKPDQASPQLEELEGSPQYPRSSDPLMIEDGAKQAKLKVSEVGIQNNNLRKNVSQKRSLQDASMPQLRIFDSDDLSRSNKKRSSPDVQEDTITNKQKKGKTIDSMVARKKVVDNQYSDLQGDQISTKTTVVANHEERSTEQIESLIEDTEQTVMTIKFFHPARMPPVQHVKEEFANFGPFDESAVRTFSKSSTCRIVFTCKSKAQSAYHHGLQKSNLFGLSRASYRIQPLKGSAAELAKSSKPNAMGGGGRRSGGASGEEMVRASVPEPGRRSYCAEDSAAAARGTAPGSGAAPAGEVNG